MGLCGAVYWPLQLLLLLLVTGNGDASTPLVIAHRGAAGEWPELTLEAFRAAADQRADFVEIDTSVTSDRQVIVLHEPQLSRTTNVANISRFADRYRTDIVFSEGVRTNFTDWFSWNFTLPEVRQMRKRQAISYRDQSYNWKFAVPTLRETLELTMGLRVGLLIEVKLCDYYGNRTGADVATLVAQEVTAAGASDRPDLVQLQTFELACAASLKRLLPRLPVYKLEKSAGVSDAQLRHWRNDLQLDGIGVHKAMVAEGGGDPASEIFNEKYQVIGTSDLIDRAHRGGLKVLVWTFRNEDRHIPWSFGQDFTKELAFHRKAGADGVITDFPESCRAAFRCGAAAHVAAGALTAVAAAVAMATGAVLA